MGRRILGWVLDFVIYAAVVGGALAFQAEYKDIDDGFGGDEIEFCEDLLDANPDFDGNCIAPPFGDRVYLIETSDSLLQSGVAFGWGLINFVLLQGLVGGSVGKLITGLRVVRADGTRAGIGRCFVRTLLWIVDGIPGLPIVGGIAALTSNGHRRVGDMVAGTYVIGSRSVGTPVTAAAAAVPPGAQPWGAMPPAAPAPASPPWAQHPPAPSPDPTNVYGAVPESSGPPPWEPPASGPGVDPTQVDTPAYEPPSTPAYETPSYEPPSHEPPSAPDLSATPPPPIEADEPMVMASDADDSTEGDEAETGSATVPEPDVVQDAAGESDSDIASDDDEIPGFDPTATVAGAHAPWTPPSSEPDPTVATPEAAPAAQPLPEPQWDQARNTYIQWDPNQGAWLQWDSAADAWKPIDT